MTKATKKSTKASATVKFVQFASGKGKIKAQQQTLIGLGLGKLNRVSVLEDTPSVRGMAAKVQHLVREVK